VTAAVRDTFEDFVVARGTGLIRFAYVLCGNHHLAEDLVQEVLARLHPRWSRIERDVDYPEAYARTAIVREYLSWRRRRVNSEAAVAVVPEARQPRPDRAQGQAPSGTSCGGRSRPSPGRSAPCWCFVSTRICPTPRSPMCSAAARYPRASSSSAAGSFGQAVRLSTSGQASGGNEQCRRAQTVRSSSVSGRLITPS